MHRFHRVNSTRIQFTAEEETARDEEEAQSVIDETVRTTKDTRITVLRVKLNDDSITFKEMKELMRLRG